MVFDPDSGRLLTLSAYGRITSFDPISGDHELVSDDEAVPPVGTGADILMARGLARDEARESLLVPDYRADVLLNVAIASGDRRVISGTPVGSGPPIDLARPPGLAVDPVGERVFYLERKSVWVLDLTTGARAPFSSDQRGSGPLIRRSTDLEYDPAANVLYLPDTLANGLLLVDGRTGDRIVVSGDSVGSGIPLVSPYNLGVDFTEGRVLIDDADNFVMVWLDNGDRALLAKRGEGSIPDTPYNGMEWSESLGLYVVAGWDRDPVPGLLLGIDPVSGEGTVLSDVNHGTGPRIGLPEDLAIHDAADRAFIVDRDVQGILAVDLITGDRTQLAGGGHGHGPYLFGVAIEVDETRNLAFVGNTFRDELLAIDLLTGDRVVVAK